MKVAKLLLVLGLGILVSCQQPRSTEAFSYAIDPSLAPAGGAIPDQGKGPRPLAAVEDKNGVVSLFIANEIVLSPKNQTELDTFLARYGGTVLETDAVPNPPPELGITLEPADTQPTEYVIRLDPSNFPLTNFKADAEARGFQGTRKISSENAARLMALALAELRAGRGASLNFVYQPAASMLFGTEEAPSGSGFLDAFNWSVFSDAGSKSSVVQAWQFVAAIGPTFRPGLAIIDGGFWLDGNGMPNISGGGTVSDLPTSYQPIQYDFAGDDYFAGGANPASCTGGSSCPWHGNNSASVATGILHNRYGAAGTGGLVAEPYLFKTDLSGSEVKRAVKTAVAWGAEIISMSFGGNCNLDCLLWPGTAGLEMAMAFSKGLVLLAAAGNDNKDVDSEYLYPCLVPDVICIGALDDGKNTRISYSNYGASVDLWAPTNIWAMPNGQTGGGLASAGGTSASTPFVAGIAAMIKAIDPSLTPAQIGKILSDTAWTDSSDSRVKRYVNAFKAVKEAAENQLPPDSFEPNNNSSQTKPLANGVSYDNLTIGPDLDYYRFTLNDYSSVTIDVTYMKNLGEVKVNLIKVADASPPAKQTVQTLLNGNRNQTKLDLVAPGTYTFQTSGNLNLYHLAVLAPPKVLDPDQFEANETLGTAKAPKPGSYLVNLHTPTDVDHYSFVVGTLTPGLQVFNFSVSFSDAPITACLYKDDMLQGACLTSKNPSFTISQAGNYKARFSSTAKTRYSFTLGTTLDKSIFQLPIPVEKIFLIDPSDEIIHWLVGLNDALAFIPGSRTTSTYDGFELVGEGLHLTLSDTRGNKIAQGQSFTTPDGQVGERISFANAASGQNHLLLVERTELPAVQEVLLPALEYALNWKKFQ